MYIICSPVSFPLCALISSPWPFCTVSGPTCSCAPQNSHSGEIITLFIEAALNISTALTHLVNIRKTSKRVAILFSDTTPAHCGTTLTESAAFQLTYSVENGQNRTPLYARSTHALACCRRQLPQHSRCKNRPFSCSTSIRTADNCMQL